MSDYTHTYTVVAKDGKGVSSLQRVSASSESHAVQIVEATDCTVQSVVRLKDVRAEGGFWSHLVRGHVRLRTGVSNSELAMLCEIFKALQQSGVPILQAVELVAAETPNLWLRDKLWRVHEQILQGVSLAEAMGDPGCRKAFPKMMRAIIETGEANGRLDISLERLAEIYKRAADLRRDTISAILYPMFALIVFCVVCIFVTIRIPPALTDVIGDEATMRETVLPHLPVAIRALFFLNDHRLILFAPFLAIACIVFLWTLGKQERFKATRLMLTRIERGVPVIGPILRHFSLVRFLDTLTVNEETGIQVTASLGMMAGSVSDAVIEDAVERMRDRIEREGSALDAAMAPEPVFPGLVKQMVHSGVVAGRLVEMLHPITAYYRENGKALLKRALELLTPLMIILLGLIIGPVIAGVYKTLQIMAKAMGGIDLDM